MFENLTAEQQQFLFRNQGINAVILNFILNALISWAVLKQFSDLVIWGDNGIGLDMLATGFLLPFITCLILSKTLAGKIRKGKAQPLAAEQISEQGWHKRSLFSRSVFLGVVGVLFAVLVLILFHYGGFMPMEMMSYVWFKGIWAGILGGVVTILIAYWTMASDLNVKTK